MLVKGLFMGREKHETAMISIFLFEIWNRSFLDSIFLISENRDCFILTATSFSLDLYEGSARDLTRIIISHQSFPKLSQLSGNLGVCWSVAKESRQ